MYNKCIVIVVCMSGKAVSIGFLGLFLTDKIDHACRYGQSKR